MAWRCSALMRRYCASNAPWRPPGLRSPAASAMPPQPPSAVSFDPHHPISIPSSSGSDALALPRHVVDEQVLAEPVGPGVERPSPVDPCHALDEGAETRAVVEHERVDHDAATADALDLLQRLLGRAHRDAAEGERPLAVESAAQEVGRRLAVGDDDDVLVVAR